MTSALKITPVMALALASAQPAFAQSTSIDTNVATGGVAGQSANLNYGPPSLIDACTSKKISVRKVSWSDLPQVEAKSKFDRSCHTKLRAAIEKACYTPYTKMTFAVKEVYKDPHASPYTCYNTLSQQEYGVQFDSSNSAIAYGFVKDWRTKLGIPVVSMK